MRIRRIVDGTAAMVCELLHTQTIARGIDPGRVVVRLDDGGTVAEIDVEVLHAKTMTLAEPNEILYGVDAADPRIKIINEAVVRCRWDGEEGWGLCERSRRIEDLAR